VSRGQARSLTESPRRRRSNHQSHAFYFSTRTRIAFLIRGALKSKKKSICAGSCNFPHVSSRERRPLMSIHFHHDDFFSSRRSGPSPRNEFPLLIATNSRETEVFFIKKSRCVHSLCASEHTRVVCSPVMSSVLCTRARFHLLAHIATRIIALRSCSAH